MTSANSQAVSINTAQLSIRININKKMKSVIINLDATENFITKKYMKNKKHFIQNKKYFYRLIGLNNMFLDNNQRQISNETILLLVIFQKYYKKLIFNVINMANYNIILEILQLKKHNSLIN